MPWWVIGILVLLGLLLLDRIFLWMELRGWIFYRRRKVTGGGGAVFGEAAELFHPAQYSAMEEQQEQSRRITQNEGADPFTPTGVGVADEHE